MDYESDNKIKKVGSTLQSENEFLCSKFLARHSTVGSSSSRFFYGASEGVPFKWESQPGKSIAPPPKSILPPLSPPPAVLAMGLPRPCIDIDEPKPKKWSRAWLATKIKKITTTNSPKIFLEGSRNIFNQRRKQQQQKNFESQKYDHSESFRSSSSSVASTLTSSSSNSSVDNKTSSNVNNDARSRAILRRMPFTCNLRGLSDIVVHFVKKA